jgi:hypothetical protein
VVPALAGKPRRPLVITHVRVEQHPHDVGAFRRADHRIEPTHHGEGDAGQADRDRERQRQKQADQSTVAQQEPALGERVPDHGGHIPS